MKFWVMVAVILAGSIAVADEGLDSAFKRLSTVERYAFGGVGIAGATSPGEKDYKLILSSPAALETFERLYRVGNIQAKCYALVGIRKLRPERFRELADSVRKSTDKVVTMRGCIVSSERVVDIVKRIDKGEF